MKTAVDPILAAGTVAALMAALDDVYGWDLPRTVPAGTTLAALWALTITVVEHPEEGVRYRATAHQTFPFAPPLPGTVVVDVLGGGGIRMNIEIPRKDTRWPSPVRPGGPARRSRRPRTALPT